MSDDTHFQREYRALEQRMKKRAEDDGDVYLPGPEPAGPVDYVLICMEPSLGRHSGDDERACVEAGARNFLSSVGDFIVHFCARRYLCLPGQQYHITDFSKGAMLVANAQKGRSERYSRWYALLQEELHLVSKPNAAIIAVGKKVESHLLLQGLATPVIRVIHYSPQARLHWHTGVVKNQEAFDAFRDTVTIENIRTSAEEVLESSRIPVKISEPVRKRLLAQMSLTEPQKELIFIYKMAFEKLRDGQHPIASGFDRNAV